MNTPRAIGTAPLLLALCAGALTGPAHAIDWDSGDWNAPVPGVDLGLIYQQHATRKHLYRDGDKALSNAVLTSDVTLLRYAHPIRLGGYVVNPNAVLPLGRLEADGNLAELGDASGVGDLLVTTPIWVVNKPEQRLFLGLAPYLIFPTGSYDKKRSLNLGENRYKTVMQVGTLLGISKHFSLEGTADVMWFGKNTEANAANETKRQKPLYQHLWYLNWHYAPTTTFALGLSWTGGGETSLDGVPQNDKVETAKWIATAGTFIDKRTQLMFSTGRDISVKNGLKEDLRFNFRLLRLFPR